METQNNEMTKSNEKKPQITREDWIIKTKRKLYLLPYIFFCIGFLNLFMGIYFGFLNENGIIKAPLWSSISAIIIGLGYCLFAFIYTIKQNPISGIGLTICSGLNLISIITDCLVNDNFKIALFVYIILFYISFRAIETLKQLKKIRSLENTKPLSN